MSQCSSQPRATILSGHLKTPSRFQNTCIKFHRFSANHLENYTFTQNQQNTPMYKFAELHKMCRI